MMICDDCRKPSGQEDERVRAYAITFWPTDKPFEALANSDTIELCGPCATRAHNAVARLKASIREMKPKAAPRSITQT